MGRSVKEKGRRDRNGVDVGDCDEDGVWLVRLTKRKEQTLLVKSKLDERNNKEKGRKIDLSRFESILGLWLEKMVQS